MRGLIDKRGSSHFEMIVAFIFFTGFVFFLFTALKPADSSALSNSVITGLRGSFEDKVYTNLSNVFLKVDNSVTDACVYIVIPDEIFSYEMIPDGSSVTELGGSIVDSNLKKVTPNRKLYIRRNNNYAFRVAFSLEFNDYGNMGNCNNELPSSKYELGNVIERQAVSYKALEEMRDAYYNNEYDDLKSDLRVPPIFDFAIVTETLPDVSMESDIPSAVDVMAESYVFGVIMENGTFINERITFKVW